MSITLQQFNQCDEAHAREAIAHCVALPAWHDALIAGRPYSSLTALRTLAERSALCWQATDLALALQAHPRIGERASGNGREAALSRSEQSAVNPADAALTQALHAGNLAYEARFGRVFLIRAKGRSGPEMLAALEQRLKNDDRQELAETLMQLREITLLRLAESIQ